MGDTKNKIRSAFEKVISYKKCEMEIVIVNSMEEAVKVADDMAEKEI